MLTEIMDIFNSQLFPLISAGLGVLLGAIVTWKFSPRKRIFSSIKDNTATLFNKEEYMAVPALAKEEYKMVLVVRTDLAMGKGKAAAQCAHAALACYKSAQKHAPLALQHWQNQGQAKVVVKVESEDDMLVLQALAISLGVVSKVIHDAGRTQIAAGSATVLGVGPGPVSLINQITGKLKLY